jgi:hypothetical protein
MVLAVPACGADTAADGSHTPSSATVQPTTSTGTASTGTASTTPAKKKKKKNVIAWILSLGPGAPDGPPEFTAYRELQELHCATVFDRVGELKEPARTLYKGAAHACLAATAGETARWAHAVAALQAVSGRTDELTCMDGAALALLDRLVTMHAEHPGRSFALAAKSKATAPPCPTIAAIAPDHGVEGTLVQMTGTHLGSDVVGVSVIDSLGNSLPAEPVDSAEGSLAFTMPEEPPSDASASVCVVVRADPDWIADGSMFTYESDTTGPPTTLDCPPAAEG